MSTKQYIISQGAYYLEMLYLSPMRWNTTTHKGRAHRFSTKAEAAFVIGDRAMEPAWVCRDTDTRVMEVPHE